MGEHDIARGVWWELIVWRHGSKEGRKRKNFAMWVGSYHGHTHLGQIYNTLWALNTKASDKHLVLSYKN